MNAATTKATVLGNQVMQLADDIGNALERAYEYQWDAAPTPAADEVRGKSKGAHNDPTVRAALDERRLRLSTAIKNIEHTVKVLGRDATELRRAVSDWERYA